MAFVTPFASTSPWGRSTARREGVRRTSHIAASSRSSGASGPARRGGRAPPHGSSFSTPSASNSYLCWESEGILSLHPGHDAKCRRSALVTAALPRPLGPSGAALVHLRDVMRPVGIRGRWREGTCRRRMRQLPLSLADSGPPWSKRASPEQARHTRVEWMQAVALCALEDDARCAAIRRPRREAWRRPDRDGPLGVCAFNRVRMYT